jgi:heat shock protein HtpX
MLATSGLLGLLYVGFALVLFYALNIGLAPMLVIIVGLAAVQYWTSDKLALAASGAKIVSPEQAPELHAMVERLCAMADLPKPRIAIVDSDVPNAFATGRNPKHAAVAVTTGLWRRLEPQEIESVLAHELSHVANRDVMLMTFASFGAAVASMILQFGFLFGGGGQSDDDDGPSAMVVILVSLVVYAVSFLLMQALSRYREFAADRGAAVLTGRPSALASALIKISGQMDRVPQRDLRAASEMNAFFIIPASAKSAAANLFATHPPVEQRIARLQRLEQQLQGTAGTSSLAA